MKLFCIFIFLFFVSLNSSSIEAYADDNDFKNTSIELSEYVIPGGDIASSITVIIHGPPNHYFEVALNSSDTSVFESSYGKKQELVDGAIIIKRGRLSSRGVEEFTYTISNAHNSKIALQARISNKGNIDKSDNKQLLLSPVVFIVSLKEMLSQNNLIGLPGPQGVPGPEGPKGDKGDPGELAALKPLVIWSGGCSVDGRNLGWNRYCLDIVEFNTATSHLSVAPEGVVNFNIAGYYRVNALAAAIVSKFAEVRFLLNGQVLFSNFEYSNAAWVKLGGDFIWPFKVGDTLSIEYLNTNSGGFAFQNWTPDGSQSRMQFIFLGPID